MVNALPESQISIREEFFVMNTMGRIRISLSNTLPLKYNRLIDLKEVKEVMDSRGLFGIGINIICEHFYRIGK